MSFKALVVVVGIASAATAVMKSRAPESGTDETTTQVSTDATESGVASVGAKVQRGFGSLGVLIVGKLINGSVAKTESKLAAMGPALKKKAGPDGRRAREAAKKALQFDAVALASLEDKHPVLAVDMAIKARSFMGVARTNLGNP